MREEDILALVKIASNCAEIGRALGGYAIMGAVIVSVNGYRPYIRRLFFVGLTSLAFSTVIPALLQHIAKVNGLVAAFIGLLFASLFAFAFIWCFFLPMKIAKHRNHAHWKAILVLNLLFFIPFGWCVALWWATVRPKTLFADGDESYSPAILSICSRAEEAAKTLDGAGHKKAADKVRLALLKDVPGEKMILRLSQVLDRLMFDFELPGALADDFRSLSEDARAAQ